MNEEILGLVKRACEGDRSAFSRLAEEHRRVAASVAYGILNDVHLSADAVQEAFLKAFQRIDQLKDPEAYVSWFLNIVRATAIDVVRRRKRWGHREVQMGESADAGEAPGRPGARGPSDALVQSEDAVHIREALGALPPEYREVILLKHLEGRSYREIARLLKTSVRAVESRLFRARQQLHRHLHVRDVAPPFAGKSKRDGAEVAETKSGRSEGRVGESEPSPDGGESQENRTRTKRSAIDATVRAVAARSHPKARPSSKRKNGRGPKSSNSRTDRANPGREPELNIRKET